MVCAFRFASQRCCRDEVISGWSFCRRRVARVPLQSGSFIFAGGRRLRWRRFLGQRICIETIGLRWERKPIVSMQIRCPKNLRQRSLRPPAKIKEPDCSGTLATLRLQKLHPEITSSRQHLWDAKRNAQTISIQPAKSLEPEFFSTR